MEVLINGQISGYRVFFFFFFLCFGLHRIHLCCPSQITGVGICMLFGTSAKSSVAMSGGCREKAKNFPSEKIKERREEVVAPRRHYRLGGAGTCDVLVRQARSSYVYLSFILIIALFTVFIFLSFVLLVEGHFWTHQNTRLADTATLQDSWSFLQK